MNDTSNAASPANCPYCGLIHKSMCPRIKRVEYSDLNPGIYKVVELFAPNDYAPKMGGSALRRRTITA